MAEYHEATLTGLRLARERLEQLPSEISTEIGKLDPSRRRGGSPYYRALQQSCDAALADAAGILARWIIRKKGGRAYSHRAEELASALNELRTEVLEVFDARDHHPQMKEREVMIAALDKTVTKARLNFKDGVYAMSDDKRPDVSHVTNVNLRDNYGNLAVPGGSFTGSQTLTFGASDEQMLAVLDQLEVLLRGSQLSSGDIEDGIDAVTLARTEIAGMQDPGRLKRTLAAAGDFALKVGAAAIGGTISAYLAAKLGI